MAREKPLDLAVVQAWLAAWNESDVFSDAAVLHLQSLIPDPLCLIVVTLGVGREPRSLVFRRWKRVLPLGNIDNRGVGIGAGSIRVEARHEPSASSRPTVIGFDTRHLADSLSLASSMFVGPVAPVAPPIGQLWHQSGVKSESFPKLERVLRWEGVDWLIAGYVSDNPSIMKQGKQECSFQEAVADAHASTKWFDCEFIYTYDGSTLGNA